MSTAFKTPSDLLMRINKHINSIEVDGLSPELSAFINDEFMKEKDQKINDEEKRIEEIYFHNLTTIHNIGKLWEILHEPVRIRRGRKLKKSPFDEEKLETIRSSVKDVVTGFEAPPNPKFSIGGYVIPDTITFEGKRVGRKPDALKNYSFADTYRAVLREQKNAPVEPVKSVEPVESINPVVSVESVNTINNVSANTNNENVNTSNIDNMNSVNNNIRKILEVDQCDKAYYHVDLFKKNIKPIAPVIPVKHSNNISVNLSSNNNIINKYVIPYIPDPLNGAIVEAYIPPPRPISKTMLKKLTKPEPIVDRMDVFLARSRSLSSSANKIYKIESPTSLLVNNSIKLESGTFLSSNVKPTPSSEPSIPESESPSKFTPKLKMTLPPCILPNVDLLPPPTPFNPSTPIRTGPGRPIGAKNKTPEQREEERLNKRRRGRPLGSPNKKGKKASNKGDREVIIYDNEVALSLNPNKLEVHMIQYTLDNPKVSYAEWTNHSDKVMEQAKDKIKEISRQNIAKWEEDTIREINVLKGKLSMGMFKSKGKNKVVYEPEPENEAEREAMNYRYELLETRKDDPFFINLLKRSFEVRKPRKFRFDDIKDINDIGSSSRCLYSDNYSVDNESSNNVSEFSGFVESVDVKDVNDKFVHDLIDLSDNHVVENISEKPNSNGSHMDSLLDLDLNLSNNVNDNPAVVDGLLNDIYNNSYNENCSYMENLIIAYLKACQFVYSMYNVMD